MTTAAAHPVCTLKPTAAALELMGRAYLEVRNFHFPEARFWKRMAGLEANMSQTGDKPRELIDQSRARTAVFDVLTNGVPIEVKVDAG